VAWEQRYSAKIEYHGQEICYPGNRSCKDVVPPATWSRRRVRKLSGTFGNIFGKVWIDSLRHNSSDACSSDLVANSVKTKGLFVSWLYKMSLFSHLAKFWPGEIWKTLCFVLTGSIINLHMCLSRDLASLCQVFLVAKQVSSNAWIITSFYEISLMPAKIDWVYFAVCFVNQLEADVLLF